MDQVADDMLMVEAAIQSGEFILPSTASTSLSLMHYVNVDSHGSVEIGNADVAIVLDFDEAYSLMRVLQEMLPHPGSMQE